MVARVEKQEQAESKDELADAIAEAQLAAAALGEAIAKMYRVNAQGPDRIRRVTVNTHHMKTEDGIDALGVKLSAVVKERA